MTASPVISGHAHIDGNNTLFVTGIGERDTPTSADSNQILFGFDAAGLAGATYAVGLGYFTDVGGYQDVVIGSYNVFSGNAAGNANNTILGSSSFVNDDVDTSVVIGWTNLIDDNSTEIVAIGTGISVPQNTERSICIGSSANIGAGSSGYNTAVGAIATIGTYPSGPVSYATALGSNTWAKHDRATALGDSAVTSAADQVALGPNVHVELLEVSSAPGSPAANKLRLYAKDSGGTTRLFYKDDGGTEHGPL